MPNNHREHTLRTEEGLAYERNFFAELCQPFHSPLSSQFESLSKQIWRSSLQLGIDKSSLSEDRRASDEILYLYTKMGISVYC
jgi:hypothetical protein